MRIVDSLKRALDQMEEVLELTELAERQKLGDEREIESLRRALRQFQQPRSFRGREEQGRRPRGEESRPRAEEPRRLSEEEPPRRFDAEEDGPRDEPTTSEEF